jgi:hypothetical protein
MSKNLNSGNYSKTVVLDPDNTLTNETKQKFRTTLYEFHNVFSQDLTGYNGAVGPLKATVNTGSVLPPQRKGRIPQFSKDKLVELQSKFYELEEQGVFARPEDTYVTVEYLYPSFLRRIQISDRIR